MIEAVFSVCYVLLLVYFFLLLEYLYENCAKNAAIHSEEEASLFGPNAFETLLKVKKHFGCSKAFWRDLRQTSSSNSVHRITYAFVLYPWTPTMGIVPSPFGKVIRRARDELRRPAALHQGRKRSQVEGLATPNFFLPDSAAFLNAWIYFSYLFWRPVESSLTFGSYLHLSAIPTKLKILWRPRRKWLVSATFIDISLESGNSVEFLQNMQTSA